METVEVVVAHQERATLRVGDVFLKVDSNQARIDVEVAAIGLAPIPTPKVLWRQAPVLALSAVPGSALGRLGEPSQASPAAWSAAGAAVRKLHDAPLPPWQAWGRKRSADSLRAALDAECERLIGDALLPADLVRRNREVAEAALRPWRPVFVHGDLQISHVFIGDGDVVTGVIDWSEAGHGDACFDLAVLTLGHEDRLRDVLDGYFADGEVDGEVDRKVDREVDDDVIRAWWSLRSLLAVRWLAEHGFDPESPGCEVDVLRARM